MPRPRALPFPEVNAQPASRLSFGTVILGAGRSSRMGRPKLLLPWANTSILGHLFQQWRSLGSSQICVVCAADDPAIQPELDRLNVPASNRIFNPAPQQGMFSSIQSAARWSGWMDGLSHFIITLGDQPHVLNETLHALLEFAAARPGHICQPRHQGHRRHPVVLPRALFVKIASTEADDLKQFLNESSGAVCYYESSDESLALDIDTPADYEKALALFHHSMMTVGQTGKRPHSAP